MYIEKTWLKLVGTYRSGRTRMSVALGTTGNAYFNQFGRGLRPEIALSYREGGLP